MMQTLFLNNSKPVLLYFNVVDVKSRKGKVKCPSDVNRSSTRSLSNRHTFLIKIHRIPDHRGKLSRKMYSLGVQIEYIFNSGPITPIL